MTSWPCVQSQGLTTLEIWVTVENDKNKNAQEFLALDLTALRQSLKTCTLGLCFSESLQLSSCLTTLLLDLNVVGFFFFNSDYTICAAFGHCRACIRSACTNFQASYLPMIR